MRWCGGAYFRCALLLLSLSLLLVLLPAPSQSRTVSFTANGIWAAPASVKETCDQHFMCTPSKLTWQPNYASHFYNNVTGCDALLRKGISKIYFHGDSYMRQIYAAMLITLNGDYKYGSIADPVQSPHCQYQQQFWEKACSTHQLNHYGRVCDGRIILDPLLIGFHKLDHCKNEKGSVIMWSFGNYKLSQYGRLGVNNASMYQEFFERDICPILRSKQTRFTGAISGHPCSVWWIPTHYRMKAYNADEQVQLVHRYNSEMRSFFDSGGCGNVNYADVYNMTRQLARRHAADAQQLTYDGVHWGMEVNLVKAQIILNALLSAD